MPRKNNTAYYIDPRDGRYVLMGKDMEKDKEEEAKAESEEEDMKYWMEVKDNEISILDNDVFRLSKKLDAVKIEAKDKRLRGSKSHRLAIVLDKVVSLIGIALLLAVIATTCICFPRTPDPAALMIELASIVLFNMFLAYVVRCVIKDLLDEAQALDWHSRHANTMLDISTGHAILFYETLVDVTSEDFPGNCMLGKSIDLYPMMKSEPALGVATILNDGLDVVLDTPLPLDCLYDNANGNYALAARAPGSWRVDFYYGVRVKATYSPDSTRFEYNLKPLTKRNEYCCAIQNHVGIGNDGIEDEYVIDKIDEMISIRRGLPPMKALTAEIDCKRQVAKKLYEKHARE